MSLGSTVRVLREATGASQQELALRSGISAPYLSLIEADRRQPTLPVLKRMARALGSPAAVLFAAALASDLDSQTNQAESSAIAHLVESVRLELAQGRLTFDLESDQCGT